MMSPAPGRWARNWPALMRDARRTERAADLFTGAVVVSVAVALAGLTWRLAGFAGTAAPAITPLAPPPAGPAAVGAAIALAPFGRVTGEGAPATALPLELHGIVLARARGVSAALIASPGGRPVAYAIGQAVGGATIDAIAMDHVVLGVNGRAETLAFPRFGPPAVPPPPGAGAPSPPSMQAMQAMAAAPAPDIIGALGATPTGSGYRIGAPPSDMATRAGLLPGDVIQTVNGQPLGDPARDRQMIAAAGASGAIRIELLRGEQHITLSMPLR